MTKFFWAVIWFGLLTRSAAALDVEHIAYERNPQLMQKTLKHAHQILASFIELMETNGTTEGVGDLENAQKILPQLASSNWQDDYLVLKNVRGIFRSVVIARGVGEVLIANHRLTEEILKSAVGLVAPEVENEMAHVQARLAAKQRLVDFLNRVLPVKYEPGVVGFALATALGTAYASLIFGGFDGYYILGAAVPALIGAVVGDLHFPPGTTPVERASKSLRVAAWGSVPVICLGTLLLLSRL
jgi:hypothetical protein